LAKPPPDEGIVLRDLAREDLPRILSWRASRELYGWLAGDFRPSSAEAEEAWFARYEANRARERRYAICLADDGEHIGNVYLLDIDPTDRKAQFHIFIAAAAHRARGYGGAALRHALAIAFGDLDLLRVTLAVLEDNAAAIALYEKTGFQRIGSRAHRKDGAQHTLIDMALARPDYADAAR